jgi:hypothetical protein
MPRVTITKTVCAHCLNATCDGAMWAWASLSENGVSVDLATIPAENKQPRCSSCFGGRKHKKALSGREVGEEVVLYFPNWARGPAHLTVRKVEA